MEGLTTSLKKWYETRFICVVGKFKKNSNQLFSVSVFVVIYKRPYNWLNSTFIDEDNHSNFESSNIN